MSAKTLIPAVAAALLGLTACELDLGNFERHSRDFHYSYPLKSGGRLSVETFNGSVEVSGWDQETVDIGGSKYGPTDQAADNLKVIVDNRPDAVSIRVVRPSGRPDRLGARFLIKIPRAAVLDRITSSNGPIRTVDGSGPARLKTSNGPIRVEGLHGSLDAQSSNGPIDLIGVDGDIVARTSNGHIHAEGLRGALDATTSNGGVNARLETTGRPVHVETSNGGVDLTLPPDLASDVHVSTRNAGITLHLPSPVNAHVMARTSNAAISSDFDVRGQGETDKHHMEGTIGNGGPLIDLSTSNGGIRLQKM